MKGGARSQEGWSLGRPRGLQHGAGHWAVLVYSLLCILLSVGPGQGAKPLSLSIPIFEMERRKASEHLT